MFSIPRNRRRSARANFSDAFRLEDSHFPGARRSRKSSRQAGDQNILGFGWGEKTVLDRYGGTASLVVYVREKKPLSRLPNARRIPKFIDGLPTDVIQTGDLKALSAADTAASCQTNPAGPQNRPFPAGVSIGGGTNTAGSFGCMVTRPDIEEPLLLSNYHVLADTDSTLRPPTFQPGFGDGPTGPSSRVGVLRGVVPILFDGSPNSMDAAVSQLERGVALPLICGLGRIQGVADPVKDTIVRMYGKSSKYSVGVVKDEIAQVVISYGQQRALFVNQWLIRPLQGGVFARGGDSGSILLNPEGQAVALLFAAGSDGSAIATPISRILGRFRVTIV